MWVLGKTLGFSFLFCFDVCFISVGFLWCDELLILSVLLRSHMSFLMPVTFSRVSNVIEPLKLLMNTSFQ